MNKNPQEQPDSSGQQDDEPNPSQAATNTNETRNNEQTNNDQSNDDQVINEQTNNDQTINNQANNNQADDSQEMNEQVTCGMFQYSTGEELTTVGSRWEMWLERFKLFVHAKSLPTDRVKSTFLLMIGPEVYEIFKSLRRKEDDETPDEAYKLLTDHFTAQRSEFAEEQKFRHMKRRDAEPIHDYVMRLRQQAAHCKFGDALERNILSQFVAGSKMPAFQEKCCRTNSLTLANAIEIAQGYESCVQNMNLLTNPTSDASIMYTERRSGTKYTQSKAEIGKRNMLCKWCGGTCENKDTCRAKGKQCRNCDKLNHFASVCRSSKPRPSESTTTRKSIKHINDRDSEPQTRYSLDSTDYAEYQRFKQGKAYGLFAVKDSETNHKNDGPRASIEINNTKLSFLIDTGAPINVIDEQTYHQIHNRPPLQQCHTKFYGYTAGSPLPILGQFVTEARSIKTITKAGFIVIKGKAELLLGYKTAVH